MRGKAGAALFEVIVALTILAVAGLAAVSMARQASASVQRLREAEAEMRAASAFLDAVALWPREDLDRRLGLREQGPWRLLIERPVPTLYVIALHDSTHTREILRTSLHRPEPSREPSWPDE